jgi:hypothetical protein
VVVTGKGDRAHTGSRSPAPALHDFRRKITHNNTNKTTGSQQQSMRSEARKYASKFLLEDFKGKKSKSSSSNNNNNNTDNNTDSKKNNRSLVAVVDVVQNSGRFVIPSAAIQAWLDRQQRCSSPS